MESRIGFERVAVAGEDHPRGERAGALAPEGVEGLVDDVARIGLAGTSLFDGVGDARGDRVGDRAGELGLEARRRAEMVEQVGMGAADLARDSLQRDRLRAVGQQQLRAASSAAERLSSGLRRLRLIDISVSYAILP